MTFSIEPAAIPADAPQPMIDPAKMPDIYAMKCSGDCMEPEIPDGALLMFDRRQEIVTGDLVAIFMRPEFVRAGFHNVGFKRIVMTPPPWVKFPFREHPKSEVHSLIIVETTNPAQQYQLKCEHILDIHYCKGLVLDDVSTKYVGAAGVELNGGAL